MRTEELRNIARFAVKKSYRELLLRSLEENAIIDINTLDENNTDCRALIIRRLNTKVGIFSDYIVFLRAIELAIEQNRIPIIDRLTVHNDFLNTDDRVNTWELFFEQPMSLGLDGITHETMQVSAFNCGVGTFPVSLLHCNDPFVITYWRKIAEKYIRLNKEMQAVADNAYNILLKGLTCLGISVREGYGKLADMKEDVIRGHPMQADTKELIDYAERKMIEWNLNDVFFTCQTIETVDLFKQRFGDHAICLDRNRPRYADLLEGENLKRRNFETAICNERDYITEISLLSKCNSLICSHNSGSDAAFIMSPGYEHVECIERGIYTI